MPNMAINIEPLLLLVSIVHHVADRSHQNEATAQEVDLDRGPRKAEITVRAR